MWLTDATLRSLDGVEITPLDDDDDQELTTKS